MSGTDDTPFEMNMTERYRRVPDCSRIASPASPDFAVLVSLLRPARNPTRMHL